MKLHGISFRIIFPNIVSPSGAAACAFSTSVAIFLQLAEQTGKLPPTARRLHAFAMTFDNSLMSRIVNVVVITTISNAYIVNFTLQGPFDAFFNFGISLYYGSKVGMHRVHIAMIEISKREFQIRIC